MVLVSKIVSCLVGTRLISCSRVLALSLVGGGDNDEGLTPFTEEVVFARAICKRVATANPGVRVIQTQGKGCLSSTCFTKAMFASLAAVWTSNVRTGNIPTQTATTWRNFVSARITINTRFMTISGIRTCNMRSSQVLARKNRNVINIALAVQQETLPALAPQIGVTGLRYGIFALIALESICALEGLKIRCLDEAFNGVRTCFTGFVRLL